MNVVVVAKTRMGRNICVGAVAIDTGKLLRLIPRHGSTYRSWPEFRPEVGDLLDVAGAPAASVDAPHVEDFIVDQCTLTAAGAKDLAGWIRGRCTVWRGDRSCLFGGRLRFTPSGKGHLDRGDPLPAQSVGFWELPAALELEPCDATRYRLVGTPPVRAKYVGLSAAPAQIRGGSLVRVSLSSWWTPDEGGKPEACWLQISGHY